VDRAIAKSVQTNTLDALVLGSGTIKHKGNTKEVTKKIYGSGAIDRLINSAFNL